MAKANSCILDGRSVGIAEALELSDGAATPCRGSGFQVQPMRKTRSPAQGWCIRCCPF
ncbi:MAG: hypothetical protein JRD93_17110 [Deltaproteobacteria bacterium]|nr:hypothetical protein [Deltaproteobacteria bacterium]